MAEPSQWTVDTLREHLQREAESHFAAVWAHFKDTDLRYGQRFEAQQEALRAALYASVQAAERAATATEKRFEGLNAFRQSLNDLTRQMLPRVEYESAHKTLTDKFYEVQSTANNISNRVSVVEGRILGAAAVGATIPTLIAIALHFIK